MTDEYPIEVVERMARMQFAMTPEYRSGFTWPIHVDWRRDRDLERARKSLAYVLGDWSPANDPRAGE